jgi:hypothetical protein
MDVSCSRREGRKGAACEPERMSRAMCDLHRYIFGETENKFHREEDLFFSLAQPVKID